MRLFVAVDLPAAVKDRLAGLIAEARSALPDAKWVPRDNLHLTLAFLGEVADDRIDAVVEALGGAVADRTPFDATLAGAGAFPSARRGRVLWIGLSSVEEQLPALADACIGALERLGFPREARPWTPHLTIARLRSPANVSAALPASVPDDRFEVSEVTLFRSRLARPAPRYEPLVRVPLGG